MEGSTEQKMKLEILYNSIFFLKVDKFWMSK